MCRPKEYGGLNFRNLVNFSKALLAKQVWRLFSNPHLLASKVLTNRYAYQGSLLTAPIKSSCSVFWRGFFWAREIVCMGTLQERRALATKYQRRNLKSRKHATKRRILSLTLRRFVTFRRSMKIFSPSVCLCVEKYVSSHSLCVENAIFVACSATKPLFSTQIPKFPAKIEISAL